MAPPHKINTLSRSLVRIPGNGSDVNARPLSLNLARTLTNTDGPLGPLVQQCLSQNQETFRPIVPLRSSESREVRPPAAGLGSISTTPSRKAPQSQKLSEGKQEVAERKRARPADSTDASPAAVRKSPDVRAPNGDRSTSGETVVAAAASVQPAGGIDRATPGPRSTLKAGSSISQLIKVFGELQRKQKENEKEKAQLKEEVELLNKKLATFREIFQDTYKLKAVLKQLNITL